MQQRLTTLIWLVLFVGIATLSLFLLGSCGNEKVQVGELLSTDQQSWKVSTDQQSYQMTFSPNGLAEFKDGDVNGQATFDINESQTEMMILFMQKSPNSTSGTIKNLQVENERMIVGDFYKEDSVKSVPIQLSK
ncbi:hypothetical protein [Enterococcus sp. AZ072]|uniref:hypothetical protein n=1 Tax=unclassified Enterococcus TaxID=2608891 RepID=UPI003D287C62